MDFVLPHVLAAPMAGGPSTPELVDAVSFGFLAFGTCSVDDARAQLARTTGDYGVNLFSEQTEKPEDTDVESIAAELGVEVPTADLTCGYPAKFAAVLDAIDAGRGPRVVSTMFGCFPETDIQALHERGVEAWVNVTNPEDALTATQRGADKLVVQGPNAGGHRGTWSITAEPDWRSLPELFAAVREVTDLPLIAAGGVRTSSDIAQLIEFGAVAVMCGSAFLLADEAGTSEFNRELLAAGGSSTSTRAFSGRYARGLETTFTREHPDMPAIYPYLNAMLKPRRSDLDFAYCLVGEPAAQLHAGSAKGIEQRLLGTLEV
ncbi:nitronate monooxygenase [Corynebacterium lubricantis]|uniref:nitronate monooxygenase n=1 Tax=Corynebacterium lubricantis TaxID=541095 RepID=UPI0003687DA8|nr:nitronate monooxygenase [Corynebacterium lubricantis]